MPSVAEDEPSSAASSSNSAIAASSDGRQLTAGSTPGVHDPSNRAVFLRDGRLMLTVLGGLAEFERELIRIRTSEGRARGKENGISLGRKPGAKFLRTSA